MRRRAIAVKPCDFIHQGSCSFSPNKKVGNDFAIRRDVEETDQLRWFRHNVYKDTRCEQDGAKFRIISFIQMTDTVMGIFVVRRGGKELELVVWRYVASESKAPETESVVGPTRMCWALI